MTASKGGALGLAAPVLIFLGLGDTFREVLSVSMDMDVADDLILGWDWISSHDLRHLYVDGRVSLRSGPAMLRLALLPADVRPAARTLSVIGHGEFRQLLRQIERAPFVSTVPDRPPTPSASPPPPPPPPLRRSPGWSRPVHADHAALAALEAAQVQALRRPGRPPEPPHVERFADGVELLKDCTELHLVFFCLADAELQLQGTDDAAFAALKHEYADVLGGAPPGMPPDRCMELELETGDAPMLDPAQ